LNEVSVISVITGRG